MSGAVHAEDHQGGDEAPAKVTVDHPGIVKMDKYEQYLFTQMCMHERLASQTRNLLNESLATRGLQWPPA